MHNPRPVLSGLYDIDTFQVYNPNGPVPGFADEMEIVELQVAVRNAAAAGESVQRLFEERLDISFCQDGTLGRCDAGPANIR